MTFSQLASRFTWMVAWAAVPLSAASIDVSVAPTAWLGRGDALSFAIPTWNYGLNAARYGLAVYPTDIGFIFMSDAANSGALFDASLETADGSISEIFGSGLAFGPGAYSGSNYSGGVSTLEASLHLSAALSQLIFGSQAVLILRNQGPAVTLGLPPNTLRQDLFVSLSCGELNVGALHGSVTLEEFVTPEPHSGVLLIVGGLFLCILARLSLPKSNPKSTVCNRVGHSDTIYEADRNPPLECRKSNQRSIRTN